MQRYQVGLWLTGICTLVGCGSPFIPTPPIEEKKYELKHERHVLTLNFPKNQVALPLDNQLSLVDYVHPAGPGKTSAHITMTCKTGGITGKRLRYLTKYLLSLGVKKKQIHCDTRLDPETSNTFDIVINTYRVIAPRCPDWRMGLGNYQGQRPHSNYGCATLTNFLLMIDDPIVLFKGTPALTHDAARETLVINDFRLGKDKGKELKTLKASTETKTS